jgi:F1F0 ATPase subunit 2
MSSLPYIGGFIFGVIAGLYYFYGLLLTIRRIPVSRYPKRLLLMSYFIRLIPVLIMLLLLVRNDPGMFITFLIGFFFMRFIMTQKIARLTKEKIHASEP